MPEIYTLLVYAVMVSTNEPIIGILVYFNTFLTQNKQHQETYILNPNFYLFLVIWFMYCYGSSRFITLLLKCKSSYSHKPLHGIQERFNRKSNSLPIQAICGLDCPDNFTLELKNKSTHFRL